MKMPMQLEKILAYQNSNVLERYHRDYPNNSLTAEKALQQVGCYLWLCKKHTAEKKQFGEREDLQFHCGIYPEMQEVDDMWHTFLLFTKDYMEYCNTYFGEFMHHTPATEASVAPSPQQEIEFERYLSYAYDHLGAETLKLWFASYFPNE